MQADADVVWSGRPWITPALVARTIVVAVVAVVLTVLISMVGPIPSLLGFSVYAVLYLILGLVWVFSLLGLLMKRASLRYTLRQSSMELEQGIARKRSLTVSPSGFSELEVDQGIMGRILNYGSVEVRAQGGQQLNLELIKDPKDVTTKIRNVMSMPTVRIAKDSPDTTSQ